MSTHHISPSLEVLTPQTGKQLPLPLLLSSVAAGFPSPADDFIDRKLDLNEHLIRNPIATYFVRAHGESMLGAGIHHNDILVVDRSASPTSGSIVIASVHGELTVKRLTQSDGKLLLQPENPAYKPIDVSEVEDFSVWGVVQWVLHKV